MIQGRSCFLNAWVDQIGLLSVKGDNSGKITLTPSGYSDRQLAYL